MCVGPTVPLNGVCDSDDVCTDVNAACIGGLCRCRPLFYEESNVCSQLTLPLVLLNVITRRLTHSNWIVLKQVENFKYLGSVIHAQGGNEEDITARIAAARKKMESVTRSVM